MRRPPRIRAVTLALAALFCMPQPAQAVLTNGANANDILGQFTDATDTTPHYTKGCVDNGASPIGFDEPGGMAIDTVHHRLFVADGDNNRVLVFTLDSSNAISSKTPANVLGQPDFVSCAAAGGQSGLDDPWGLAYDGTNDRLFVADTGNSRVLAFNTSSISNGMNAANVLGADDFTDYGTGTCQNCLSETSHLAYDAANSRLFVTDWTASRVLVFDVTSITDGENAVHVLGQPDFDTGDTAVTQSGMNASSGLAYDGTHNRLFVSDRQNDRILVFDAASITDGENAVNVLGQTDFVSTGTGTNQSGLSKPTDVAYDAAHDRLFVADFYDQRVMVFDTASITNGENAVNELGQPDFDTFDLGTTQSQFYVPQQTVPSLPLLWWGVRATLPCKPRINEEPHRKNEKAASCA